MNIMRKYLLSSVYRSPDYPAAEPVEPVAEPVLTADTVVDSAVIEPEPEPVAVPAPKAEAPKWALERIGEETTRRLEETAKREQAEARANALEEITRRLQAGEPKTGEPLPARPAAPAADQSAVQQEAARQLFERDAQSVSEAGVKTYGPRWDVAIKSLNLYGANSTEFVSNVMEIDQAKAHEIMFQLAQDGDLAVRLTRMTPTKRIAEITRMVMAQAAPADLKPADSKPAAEVKPAISRAPAPKPAIAPHAAAPEVNPETAEGNEKMSDKQWEEWYKGKYLKRA